MEIIKLNELIEFGDQFVPKRIADMPALQMNLVCLRPEQSVPPHNANSNVRLLVLTGEITLTLNDETQKLSTHDMAVVPFQTPMRIRNDGPKDAAFIVIKTPNPSEMEQA